MSKMEYLPCCCGRNLNLPKEVKSDGTLICRCGKESKPDAKEEEE